MKNLVIFLISMMVGISVLLCYHHFLPVQQTLSKPQTATSHFSLDQAPKNSLTVNIASTVGAVEWQSRVATTSSPLSETKTLQQGEAIMTKDTGKSTLQIPDCCTIILSPNTKLDLIQTLPINIVLSQEDGKVTYTQTGTHPVSINTLDLLIQPHAGTTIVTTNTIQQTVTMQVVSGTAKAVYTDTDNAIQMQTLTAGQTLLFDDQAKEITIK